MRAECFIGTRKAIFLALVCWGCLFATLPAQAWVVTVPGTGSGSGTLYWVASQINQGKGDATITFATNGYFSIAEVTSRYVTITAEIGKQNFGGLYFSKGGDVTGVDSEVISLGVPPSDKRNRVIGCKASDDVNIHGDNAELRETYCYGNGNLNMQGDNITVVSNHLRGEVKLGSNMAEFRDNTMSARIHFGTNNVIDGGVFSNSTVYLYENVVFTNCQASGTMSYYLGTEDNIGAGGGNKLSAPSGSNSTYLLYVYNNSNTVQGFTDGGFTVDGSYNAISDNTCQLSVDGSHNAMVGNTLLGGGGKNGTNNSFLNNTFITNSASEIFSVRGRDHQFTSNTFFGMEVSMYATNVLFEQSEFVGSRARLHLRGDSNTVRASYFGMSRAGETNASHICMYVRGTGNVIGGPGAQDWNLFVTDEDGTAIDLQADARDTLIQNNFFGVDIHGNLPGCYQAILLIEPEGVDIIGNVIASSYYGIRSDEYRSAKNITIQGNIIGTDSTGRRVITNAYSSDQRAIKLYGDTNVVIGGEALADRNIIGNQWGAFATEFNGITDLTIQNNYVGLGDDGSTALPNLGRGVRFNNCRNVLIGGTNEAARNVIGNTAAGRAGLSGYRGDGITIQGNYVGLCADGLTHAPVGREGIEAQQCRNLLIGGAEEGAGNVIGATGSDGIFFSSYGYPAVCQGNIVGFGSDGVTPGYIGNRGIMTYCDYNSAGTNEHLVRVGGLEGVATDALFEGNLIGNCSGSGLWLEGGRVLAAGNWVGVDWSGTNVVGNGGHGASLFTGRKITVSGNLLVGNDQSGLYLYQAMENTIVSNRIGILYNDAPAGNSSNGIAIVDDSQSNVIGHVLLDDPHAIGQQRGCNIIANNAHAAILINGVNEWDPDMVGPKGVLIQGNEIQGNAFEPVIRIEQVGKNGGEPIRIGGAQQNQANIILDGQIGVDLFDAHGVYFGHNFIGFNPKDTTEKAEKMNYGIKAEECSDLKIGEDGRVAAGACWENGILVKACTDVYSKDLRIGVFEDELSFGGYADIGNKGEGILVQLSTNIFLGSAGIPSLIANNDTGIRVEESEDVFIVACQVGVMNELLDMGNTGSGISLWQTRRAQLGDAQMGEIARNVIGGSEWDGIELDNSGNVDVELNWSGIQTNGVTAFPNGGNGLGIYNTTNVVIGGIADAVNVFSGNARHGVLATNFYGYTNGLVIKRARVGVSADGMAVVTNGQDGVRIHGIPNNVIGGAGVGNQFAGNRDAGLRIVGTQCVNNVLAGNLAGVNALGNAALPNSGDGIVIENVPGIVVGGGEGMGNVLSGNAGAGLRIQGADATGGLIVGNIFGLDATGASAVPNGHGLIICDAAETLITNNVLSGNTGNGVIVSNSAPPYSAAMNNRIVNNLIGTDINGTTALGNGDNGVLLSYVTFAHVGPGNLIAANADDGVEVWGMASHDNFVQGNIIGSLPALGNGGHGVQLHGSDANRVGGTNAWQANEISYNAVHGVAVFTGNQNPVLGNSIYSNLNMGIRLGTNATPYPAVTGPGYPNNHQWAPVITNATLDEEYTLTIQGYIETGASQPYTIEYFLTETVNTRGYGEGHYPLYRETLVTDAEGRATFFVPLPDMITASTGMIVTATATDTNRNSSAFSWARQITEPGEIPPDPVAVTSVNPSGPATAQTGQNVQFNAQHAPSNATLPIVFTWTPEPQSGQGSTQAVYQFDVAGVYNVAVIAANQAGSATGQTTITVTAAPVQTGTVVAVIEPAGANTDGAGWRIVGADTNWLASGASLGMPTGSYAVEFKPLDGWQKPGDALVNVQADTTHTVTGVYACALSVSPSSFTLQPSSFTGTVQVTVGSGCEIPWTAATASDWITLTGATNGNTSGLVTFEAEENEGRTRTGTVQINDQTVTIRQRGITSALDWLVILFE